MAKNYYLLFVIVVLLVMVLLIAFLDKKDISEEIVVNDFESCAKAGNTIMESYPRQCVYKSNIYFEQIDEYLENYSNKNFIEEFNNRAVENIGGLPIEGFNPELYIKAFPGMKYSDFNGASAIGGVWKYENDELKWIPHNQGGYITSADGTIDENGLNVVIGNLEKRLGIIVDSKDNANKIIEIISSYFCGDSGINIGVCIAIYDPVCGWNNPQKVQCIKYPCASTYSNGCEACRNENVLYWTTGECPA